MLALPSAPPHTHTHTCGTRHKATGLASVSSESQPSSSEAKSQLTDFLQNPQNPPRALPVQDVIHILKSQFSLWDIILTFLNDTPSLCAR